MSLNEITFKGHSSSVYSVALSPDSRNIATGSYDTTVILWNASTGELVRTLTGHTATVWSLQFLPDGNFLVTGSEDKTVRVWNVRFDVEQSKETLAKKIEDSESSEVTSPQACGVLLFEGHQAAVNSVAVSSNGTYIASGSSDKTAKIWNIQTWCEVRTFDGHSSDVQAVAFSSDDKFLVTGSNDTTSKLWDVSTGAELMLFGGHSGTVNSVALSSDGRYLLTGSSDYTAKVWQIRDGMEVKTLKGHSDRVYSVALSSDCRSIVTGSRDKTAKIWNFETGEEIRTFNLHKDHVRSVAISRDARFLVSVGAGDKTAQLVDLFALGVGRTPFFHFIAEVFQNEDKWPPYLVLHELSGKVSNVQELKLVYSAASATFKAGEITLSMKNRFITRAFETAAEEFRFDEDKRVFASLVMVLKKAKADGAIDEKEYVRLEQVFVSADVFADYRFQSLAEVVRQNTARIDAVEARLDALEEYVQKIDQDLQDFKAAYRRTMQIKAASGVIGAIAGIFTFGMANGLAAAIGDSFASSLDGIVDYSDTTHILNEMELDDNIVTNESFCSDDCSYLDGGSVDNDGSDDIMELAKNIGFAAVKVITLSKKPWKDVLEDEFIQENTDLIPVIGVIKLSAALSGPGKTQAGAPHQTYGLGSSALISKAREPILQIGLSKEDELPCDTPEISNVLRELRLDHHGQLFADNGVDGINDLRNMSEQNLVDMGLKKVGERNRLMNWIRDEQKYRLVFAQIDKDSDGKITIEECLSALEVLGVVVDDDSTLRSLFAQSDANESNSIISDPDEMFPDKFVRLLHRAKAGDPTTSLLRGIAEHPETVLERLKGVST